MKTSPHALTIVMVCAFLSASCRDRKCDGSSSATPSPSASGSASGSNKAGQIVEDVEARSLCALLAFPTPPERTDDHDWETSTIPTQTKGRFGWVRMSGETKKTKFDDVEVFLKNVEAARSKAEPAVASHACKKFRDDREGRVVITVTYRTKGDAQKGDYWNYVALGTGANSPPGIRWVMWGATEESAKLGALRQARILMGLQDADVSTLVDEWLGPREAPH